MSTRQHRRHPSRLQWLLPLLLLTGFAATLLAQQSESPGAGSLRSSLVPILAELVAGARDDAIASGTKGIPPGIRDTLAGFVPADTLDTVRWRIGGESGLIGRGLFAVSSAYAVTLDRVIVFADAEKAADASVWAHEIRHVMQFDDWGIEGFVQRYLDDADAVERDAREFQYQWWKATRWQGAPPGTTSSDRG